MTRAASSDDIARVGIAIRFEPAGHLHIGILHRGSDSAAVRMLHLAWHHDLRDESPEDGYLWLKPGINARRLKQVASRCRQIWRGNKRDRIPFGFSPPSNCFSEETGRYLFGPTQHGLTCATFVLAVFGWAGLTLINYGSWPLGRAGDLEWQESIVAQLVEKSDDQEHIDFVRGDIGVARFQPEEVAGASLESRIPVEFEVAEQRSQEVLDRLRGN